MRPNNQPYEETKLKNKKITVCSPVTVTHIRGSVVEIDNKLSPYYTIHIDWERNGEYSPEFGDWDISIVMDELEEYEGEKSKIIKTIEIDDGIRY